MEVKDSHIEFYEVIVKQKQGNGSQRGDYGRIAKITLHKADDMERVGKVLIALAHAVREVESSNG